MRVGAVIAAAGKSGGYKSYDKMKSVDGIQVLRQMILNFKRAGVDEIVLITGYQAEQVEKKLAKLGAVFLRSEDYEKEEMITSAVRGMNYLKPRCEKFFFCPAGVSLFIPAKSPPVGSSQHHLREPAAGSSVRRLPHASPHKLPAGY